MLVLSRRVGEQIVLTDLEVRITLVSAGNGRARLAITAPREVRVLRAELCGRPPDGLAEEDGHVRSTE